jgi:hypothetical protein
MAFAATPTRAFSGPWNSAHTPATITARGITAQPATSEAYEVKVGAALSCPNGAPVPIVVSFSDPSGSQSASLSQPCKGQWTEPAPDERLDFSLRTFAGTAGALEPSVTFISASSTPLVYEASSPSGVIARGALLATVVPPRVIAEHEQRNEYITVCIDGKRELRYKKGGDRYCEVGGGTNYSPSDWPAPPIAKPKAPGVKKPKVPPVVKKPKYPALTLATAPYWTEIAVEYHFGYRSAPSEFRATRCANRAAGRVSCDVSWRTSSYMFAGAVKVGAANVYTGRYKYALRIVRTDMRTHQRQTFLTG